MNDVDVKLLEKSFKRYYLSHISEIQSLRKLRKESLDTKNLPEA